MSTLPFCTTTKSSPEIPSPSKALVRFVFWTVMSIEWSERRMSTVRSHSPRVRRSPTSRSISWSACMIAASYEGPVPVPCPALSI